MLTIKSIEDFKKIRDYPIQPLCYVYYKESLLNCYYVGFTRQNVYIYLRSHHKMKYIVDRLNEGFYIQIYKKYNEDSLIKLFKPKLNIFKGTGILGRTIPTNGIPKNVGEVISMTQIKSYKKNKKINNNFDLCETIWNDLFKNKKIIVSIDNNIINYILDKERLKPENKKYEELFNRIYNNENNISKLNTNTFIKCICLILKYCKIKSLFSSFILIHQSYINNSKKMKISDKGYKEQLSLEMSKNLHNEIIRELKKNNYLISYSHLINIQIELSYLYRVAIRENFNETYSIRI